jgi:hypothetical protein
MSAGTQLLDSRCMNCVEGPYADRYSCQGVIFKTRITSKYERNLVNPVKYVEEQDILSPCRYLQLLM